MTYYDSSTDHESGLSPGVRRSCCESTAAVDASGGRAAGQRDQLACLHARVDINEANYYRCGRFRSRTRPAPRRCRIRRGSRLTGPAAEPAAAGGVRVHDGVSRLCDRRAPLDSYLNFRGRRFRKLVAQRSPECEFRPSAHHERACSASRAWQTPTMSFRLEGDRMPPRS